MYFYTIIAYAFLFWQGEQRIRWMPFADRDTTWTLSVLIGQSILIALGSRVVCRRLSRLAAANQGVSDRCHRFHHRASFVLRCGVLTSFALTIFTTSWMDWCSWGRLTPPLQVFSDLAVLVPYGANFLILWTITYPAESMLRSVAPVEAIPEQIGGEAPWPFRAYLGFHVRHYILVVAVPLTLILFAANLARGYDSAIISWTGWVWTPDAVLATVALAVFMSAPAMLRRIWRTAPLEPGPVRDRLERCAARINLRFREILVWKTDGVMINAAAMGLLARVRYVLLSDALLDTMSAEQVQAVFGHEAGHVRHHHIQYFLAFAVVGWVLVAGLMEGLAGIATMLRLPSESSFLAIEVISVAVTVAFWGIGFGWVSRRFEWQADVFGAQCVTPQPVQCRMPCGVHPGGDQVVNNPGRVCMTGAAVFASALERVATLNGIPRDERSWRHSSISYRVRRLFSLAGDADRAKRFARQIRRLQRSLVTIAVVGSIVSIVYLLIQTEPAIMRLQAQVEQQAVAS